MYIYGLDYALNYPYFFWVQKPIHCSEHDKKIEEGCSE